MKMKFFTLMVLGLISVNLMAQTEDDNWVSNPGFEDIGTKKLKKDKCLHYATGWSNANGMKADLYSAKNKDEFTGADGNQYGKEKPEEGENYAGIVAYSYGDKIQRTYVTTELVGEMKKGQEYCVRFRVSLADNSKYAVNNIGAAITAKSLVTEDKKSILTETNIQHSKNKVMNQTYGWETICSIYKAEGGEKYLTIGNFSLTKDTKSEKTIKPKGVTRQHAIAYYFVDRVEVFVLDSVEQCQCERVTTEKAHVVITEDFSSNKDFTPEQKVEQVKVLFDYMQTDVTKIYLDKINQLITVLNDNPELKVEMHAHSDKAEVKAGETDETKKEIAKKRSESVLKVLAEAGVDKSRIKVIVHDDTEPATTETSEMGKAKNRRIEFNVQK